MLHTREEVIERITREFELLDHLVESLSDDEWNRRLLRSETKDPWTVKDALAHITHWKANTARSIRGQRIPSDERGLGINDGNHLVYLRWRDRSPQEVHPEQRNGQLYPEREGPKRSGDLHPFRAHDP